MGMNNKQIQALKQLADKSRWVTIIRGYPQMLFTEKDLLFIKDLE